MSGAKFKVSYPAVAQLALLQDTEKTALRRLFASAEVEQQATTKAIGDGRFVSQLGTKRVLWRRVPPRMTPEILSIVDRTFADAG